MANVLIYLNVFIVFYKYVIGLCYWFQCAMYNSVYLLDKLITHS